MLYLLLFAAAYAGAGRAVRLQRDVGRWAIGMWVVNAWMAVNVIAISSSLKNQHVEDPFHVLNGRLEAIAARRRSPPVLARSSGRARHVSP